MKTDSYSAYARNKLIAEAFYLTGDIEKYGSGFLRIRDALSLYPTMKMDFKEIGGGFSDISEKLNISRSAIQKHIENLKSKCLIERVGAEQP